MILKTHPILAITRWYFYVNLSWPCRLDISLSFLCLLLQTAYTVPILAFAFVCHPEVLPIYSELKEWVLFSYLTIIEKWWVFHNTLFSFSLQSQPKENAKCIQPVDFGHAYNVHAVGSVWLPHILRYVLLSHTQQETALGVTVVIYEIFVWCCSSISFAFSSLLSFFVHTLTNR